jgi:hypothetical protein
LIIRKYASKDSEGKLLRGADTRNLAQSIARRSSRARLTFYFALAQARGISGSRGRVTGFRRAGFRAPANFPPGSSFQHSFYFS